jgi:hypothetical protein
MAGPTTRTELKDYCLRRLGNPVIQINVDATQLEDRLDDALQYFQEYHSDAVKRHYVKHEVTQTDINNKYITLTDDLTSVIRVFNMTNNSNGADMFDVSYQLHLNDFFDFRRAQDVSTFATYQQHLSMIDDMFNNTHQIRYARHEDRLYIDMDWDEKTTVGDYIIVEAYAIIDPQQHSQVYNDRFLKEYATALFKEQWGMNISKYDGIQLPGGVTMNGQQILQSAQEEIQRLEEEMQLRHELPVDFYTG